jgi:signal peptidase I
MLTAELQTELGVPLRWVQPRGVSKGAMALITVSSASGEKSVLISNKGVMVVDSKNYVIAPKERVKPPSHPVRNALKLSTTVAAWSLVAFLLSFSLLNASGLIKSQIVLTGSMSPSIKPGDMIISISPNKKAPQVGDVVVYTGKRFDGSKVASFSHRIIDGNAATGFTVKGDNNQYPDTQKPVLSEIEGVVLFTIPFVGKLLNPQIFVLLLLCGFGIWLILDAFRETE